MNGTRICSVEGCDRPRSGRGWCKAHYDRWRNYGDVLAWKPLYQHPPKVCTVEGCDRPNNGGGLCSAHYSRQHAHGDVLAGVPISQERSRGSLADRLARRVEVMPNGCHEWTGERKPDGYGQIRPGGMARSITTHRAAWIVAHGDIPEGMFVCHRCDNPPCCNPDHLFLGTAKDNNRDRVLKGRFVGEESPSARLTNAQVIEVRAMYARGCTYAEMSEFLGGVDSSSLSAIIHGRRWGHLPGIPAQKRRRARRSEAP